MSYSKKELEQREEEFKKKIKRSRLELDNKPEGQRTAIAMRYDIEKMLLR